MKNEVRISIIVAVAENGAIGLRGGLLYRLPADLRRFKQLTTGHTVLMGRKTYESLPKGALPNRRNIVLSRQGEVADFPGCDLFRSLDEALADCASAGETEAFIIGGAQLYQAALPLAQRLCLTQIHDTPPEADTFFPPIEQDKWQETFRERHEPDEKHSVAFSFVDLVRRGGAAPSIRL